MSKGFGNQKRTSKIKYFILRVANIYNQKHSSETNKKKLDTPDLRDYNPLISSGKEARPMTTKQVTTRPVQFSAPPQGDDISR